MATFKKKGKLIGLLEVEKPVKGKEHFGDVKDTEEVFETDGTIIKASCSFKQTVNFNSFGIVVGIELPTTLAKVAKDYEKAWDIVGKQLLLKQDEVTDFLEQL